MPYIGHDLAQIAGQLFLIALAVFLVWLFIKWADNYR